jgi:hypothetical protein
MKDIIIVFVLITALVLAATVVTPFVITALMGVTP